MKKFNKVRKIVLLFPFFLILYTYIISPCEFSYYTVFKKSFLTHRFFLLKPKHPGPYQEQKFSKGTPTIYGITPTYARLTQKADLTRLLQTLLNVPDFHWIVVEDSDYKTALVTELLKESGICYTHLNVATNPAYDMTNREGIDQRNAGLAWIRKNVLREEEGVVYFMDDDNTYSLKVFDEMRTTKVASCWLIGFAGGLKFEGPGKCENGTVLSWYSIWNLDRKFPIDMCSFAVKLERLFKFPKVWFSWKWGRGMLESKFLESLNLTKSDMEAKANCTEVLAWHTKTAHPVIEQQHVRSKYLASFNINVAV